MLKSVVGTVKVVFVFSILFVWPLVFACDDDHGGNHAGNDNNVVADDDGAADDDFLGDDDDNDNNNDDNDDNDDNNDNDNNDHGFGPRAHGEPDDLIWDFQYELVAGGSLEDESIANAVGPNGERYLAYVKGAALILYTADEKTEKYEQVAGPAHYPQMEIDDEGRLHLFYYDVLSKRMVYQTNRSGAWRRQPATESFASLSSSFKLDMSLNPVGEPAVAYLNPDLHYASRLFGTWSDRFVTADSITEISMQIGGDGVPQILARSLRNNLSLMERYSLNSESEWKKSIMGVFPAYLDFEIILFVFYHSGPSMALDNEGLIRGAYHLNTYSYDMFIGGEMLNGIIEILFQKPAVWEREFIGGTADGWLDRSALAVDSENETHIVYTEQPLTTLSWNTAAAVDAVETPNDKNNNRLYYWISGHQPTYLDSPITGPIDIALDPDDVPSVCYLRDTSDTTCNLYLAEPDGKAWNTRRVDLYEVAGGHFDAVAGTEDCLHLIYPEHSIVVNKVIYAKVCNDVWTRQILPYSASSSESSALAVDPRGAVHVAILNGSEHNLIYGKETADRWVFEELPNDYPDDSEISLDVDSAGDPYLAYFLESPTAADEYLLCLSMKKDGVWQHTEIAAAELSTPGLIVDANDAVHLSYLLITPRYSVFQSGGWLTENPDPGANSSLDVAMALDPLSGEPVLVYTDNNSQYLKLAKRQAGQWFNCYLDDPDHLGFDESLSIAVDQSGYLHLLYHTGPTYNSLKYMSSVAGAMQMQTVYPGVSGYSNALVVDDQGNVNILFNHEQSLWRAHYQIEEAADLL